MYTNSQGHDIMRASLFAPMSERAVDTVHNYISNAAESLSAAGAGISEYYANVFNSFNMFNSHEIVQRVKGIGRQLITAWDGDHIRPLTTMAEFQNPGLAMMGWIMTDPYIRERHQAGLCAGYDEGYIDNEPGAIGVDHGPWRVANNGLEQNIDGKDYHVTYFDDYVDNVNPLDIMEVTYIDNTLRSVRAALMEEMEDPTSSFNASL